MAYDTLQALRGSIEPEDLISSIKYNRQFKKEHPDWFEPDGIIVFSGPQGSGKTLSAVRYIDKLLTAYPKAKICSNVDIKGYQDRFIFFDSVKNLRLLIMESMELYIL